ncbi:MAG: CRISPR-associated helicase Cas3' [Anaerolineales bacterium]|nr:CRISPR-associated helicase Cas3' [Anaerolineales bacterium]
MTGRTKAERLEEMKRLYIQRAYTDIELAERLGVDRTLIYRDRIELTTQYPIEADEQGRYHIPRAKLISEIKVNLHEALALYLAVKKTSRQTRFHQPHAVNAVEKLAATLRQPMTEKLLKLADTVLKQEKDPERIKITEILTQSWVEQKKVRIRYQRLENKDFVTHVVHPYLIEPSIWSDSIYVIAYSEVMEKVVPFKIDRVDSATLSGEEFDLPTNFDEQELLKHAWGIWYEEKQPVIIKLRFSPTVTRRVKESIWHPLEKVEDTEDGGCIWSVDIAEWREMLPWIRGWGADCEVLEPKELQTALVRETQDLAELYKVVEVVMKKTEYYGHSLKDKDKSEWQLLKTHLSDTARLAKQFGEDAKVGDLAYVAGLLHDIGKYSKAFQKRLDGKGPKVDHATAGAKEILNLFNGNPLKKTLATVVSYCIAGHHTGLPDYGDSSDVDGTGTLVSRTEKKRLEDFKDYKTEIDTSSLELKPRTLKTSNNEFSTAFMTRMIFSALVDADFQDTQNFMRQSEKPRGDHASIDELCNNFNEAIKKFDNPENEINKKRTETLKHCIEQAGSEQGFFTLTIPTGGGKTLASMAFALNHAKKHGLKRVIYVIPFTSIIEQNASVFKEYLGEENVLEHHSNFDWQKEDKKDSEDADDETKDAVEKLKLASENWDIPIVVTTNVQFFESLYANKNSRCRKLHNIAKSVIVFDEAQTLPQEYLDPCMLAVKELVVNYGASAVFCTATQPVLNKRLENVKFTELAPNPQALFDFYKRVQITNIGKTPDADLIEKIKLHQQALCIVNTRKHAKGLFDQLEGEGNFHLSTLMCPAHRKEVLKKIRSLLTDRNNPICRVISTQVMEAGIDVDFPVGFRALAGLDSIIQAAGRVNREMKRDVGNIFVFDPETPFIKKIPTFVKQGATVAEITLREFANNPDSTSAIESYFNFLYNIQGKNAFDVKKILLNFENGLAFDFKKIAEDFRMIDNNTVSVIIPYNEEAKELLEQARDPYSYPYKFARQLQMYTVNIYEKEFEKIQSKGVIETYNETYQVLNNMSFYDKHTGLILPADAGGDALFFDG